eukprot:gene12782-26949_t
MFAPVQIDKPYFEVDSIPHHIQKDSNIADNFDNNNEHHQHNGRSTLSSFLTSTIQGQDNSNTHQLASKLMTEANTAAKPIEQLPEDQLASIDVVSQYPESNTIQNTDKQLPELINQYNLSPTNSKLATLSNLAQKFSKSSISPIKGTIDNDNINDNDINKDKDYPFPHNNANQTKDMSSKHDTKPMSPSPRPIIRDPARHSPSTTTSTTNTNTNTSLEQKSPKYIKTVQVQVQETWSRSSRGNPSPMKKNSIRSNRGGMSTGTETDSRVSLSSSLSSSLGIEGIRGKELSAIKDKVRVAVQQLAQSGLESAYSHSNNHNHTKGHGSSRASVSLSVARQLMNKSFGSQDDIHDITSLREERRAWVEAKQETEKLRREQEK